MVLRLAFSVCTCTNPEILLLDEWIGGGDRVFLEKAEARLLQFIDRSKILVLATHSMELVRRLCNKSLLLENGQLKAFGSPDEVLALYMAHG